VGGNDRTQGGTVGRARAAVTAPGSGPSNRTGGGLDDLLDIACAAARAGAEVALTWWGRADELRIEEKAAADDLVSQADRDAERAVRALLGQRRPDDGVLGEEGGSTTGRSGVRWIVDPIDGTTNYLYGRPDWAVSVAAARIADGRLLAAAVAEPALRRLTGARLGGGIQGGGPQTSGWRMPADRVPELCHAIIELNLGREDQKAHAGRMVDALVPRVRDVRRGGSAASALAQLATGRADAVWAPGLQPWDCAAGVLLAGEAGHVVGDLTGPSKGTWPSSGDVLAAPPALWEPLRTLLAGVYPS
jgi:myo-inositol-1(or 4)-monophosphatase